MTITGIRPAPKNEWSSPRQPGQTSVVMGNDMRKTDSGAKSPNDTSCIVTDGGHPAREMSDEMKQFYNQLLDLCNDSDCPFREQSMVLLAASKAAFEQGNPHPRFDSFGEAVSEFDGRRESIVADGGRQPDDDEPRWRFEWRNLKNSRRFPL